MNIVSTGVASAEGSPAVSWEVPGAEILADLGRQSLAGRQINKWNLSQGPARMRLDSWFWRGSNARDIDGTQDGQWVSRMKQNSSYQVWDTEVCLGAQGTWCWNAGHQTKVFNRFLSKARETRGHFPNWTYTCSSVAPAVRRGAPGPGQPGRGVTPHSRHAQFVFSKRKISG